MNKNIYLKRGKEESLERFHPWVFSGAIHRIDSGIEEGDVVNVFTSDNRLIGTGHYQIGSIAVRILDFSDRTIDAAFYEERLQEALNLRVALKLIREDFQVGAWRGRLFAGSCNRRVWQHSRAASTLSRYALSPENDCRGTHKTQWHQH